MSFRVVLTPQAMSLRPALTQIIVLLGVELGVACGTQAGTGGPALQVVLDLKHTCEVTSLALSDDGKCLVTGYRGKEPENGTANLWDLSTGKKTQTFETKTYWVSCVAISADGKQVVTGSVNRLAILWEASSGKKLQAYDPVGRS